MFSRQTRSIAACAVLALLSSCAMFGGGKYESAEGGTYYTKVNMWYSRSGEIESTNYHVGDMLPAGTRVTVTKCRGGKIKFETGSGKMLKLVHSKRHSRIQFGELFHRHFGKSDVTSDAGMYNGFSPREQTNVDRGKIATGMSKDAVLVAFGYPPSHRTPDLDADTWTYWVGRRTAVLHFKNDTVRSIEGEGSARAVKIYVVSDPPGAMIDVDGEPAGKAPCIVDIEIGPRDMSGRKTFRASPAEPAAPCLGVLCDAVTDPGPKGGDAITVREVIPLAGGHRLGLVPGDKILSVNGKRIRNEFECMDAIRRAGFGKPLKVLVRRGNREMSLLGSTDVKESGAFYPRTREYTVAALADMDGKVMFFDLRTKAGGAAAPPAVKRPPTAAARPPAVTPVPDRNLPDLPMVASGFLVTGQGHVLTSAHLLKGVKRIVVRTAGGRKHSASVVHTDNVNDWCLLSAPTLRGTPLAVGDDSGIKAGARVFRLGYPLGGGTAALDVSSGRIVSAQGFGGDPRHLQVQVDGGTKDVSGAPVVNARGEWLGVVSDRLDKIIHAFAGGAAADVNFLLRSKTIAGQLPSGAVLQPAPAKPGPELDSTSARKRLSSAVLAVHGK